MKPAALLVLIACSAFAQNPLTESVMGKYQTLRRNLVGAAEAMPEDGYGFRLTPAQRPFGEWIGHTAMLNHAFCASIKGEKPAPAHPSQAGATKTELVRAIKESFDYCDAALAGMTDDQALKPVMINGKPSHPVTAMISLIASGNEHYGNLVGYLRSKGIVPPSSAAAQKPQDQLKKLSNQP